MPSYHYGLNQRCYALLSEATRRYTRFHADRPMTEAWTGLGTATEYAPAIKAGLMEYATSPNPRHTTWWRLTDKGAVIVAGMIAAGENYETIEARG